MEANKIVAQHYKIVKPLFQINSYLYVQRTLLFTQSARSKTTKL